MIPVGAGEAGLLSGSFSDLLTDTATVYAVDPSTGASTVEIKTGLACRLERSPTQEQATGAARPELAGSRVFRWDPAYALRYGVQIAVDGITRLDIDGNAYTPRWNPIAGTYLDVRPPGGGTVVQRDCRVIEVLP